MFLSCFVNLLLIPLKVDTNIAIEMYVSSRFASVTVNLGPTFLSGDADDYGGVDNDGDDDSDDEDDADNGDDDSDDDDDYDDDDYDQEHWQQTRGQ